MNDLLKSITFGGSCRSAAAEACVQLAAKAAVLKDGQITQPHTGLVIEPAAVKHTTAPHFSFRLLTGETHVCTCEERQRDEVPTARTKEIDIDCVCILPEVQVMQSTFPADLSSPIHSR